MKRVTLLFLLLTLAVAAGCRDKDAPPASKPGQIVTTAAFEKYFGKPPAADKDTAYAFVIYFPSAKDPGKFLPLPFFSFDQATLKKVAIQRLLAGFDIPAYREQLLPLPPKTRLVSMSEEGSGATVTLSKEFTDGGKAGTAENFARAVSLTLRQFQGVASVRVLVEGDRTPIDAQSDEVAVAAPGPPGIVKVVAMRDKGEKEIEELNVFFDRPVDIKELRVISEDGKDFPGELYHSVFDMAGVLKPRAPAQFVQGMPVKVRWKIVDKLGRQGEGESVWPLEVNQHEQ